MDLVFTKRERKHDRLAIVRPDGTEELVACPKQRIIPHDMVHYAVESVLAARGFLGRVHGGEAAGATMAGDRESDGVERLVEVFQGDSWSGGTAPAGELIDLYGVTCEARSCPALPLDERAVEAVRSRIGELTRAWVALPVGRSMTLRFD